MDFTLSAAEHHSRNPFYPFDAILQRVMGRNTAAAAQSLQRTTYAEQQLLSLYLEPSMNPFAASLLLLESPERVMQRTLRDLFRIGAILEDQRREQAGIPTPTGQSHRLLRLHIENARFLSPAFLRLAEQIVEIGHEQNVGVSIELDSWGGDELPLGVWAREYTRPQHSCTQRVTPDEMVRVFLTNSVAFYHERLIATLFDPDSPIDDRQWSWLLLSRAHDADKVIPRLLAELIKPGEIDPRLLFVLNVGIGAYYNEHNKLDEASRIFEQTYAQYKDSSDSLAVHPEIRRFFWFKMGELLSKNREYLQEPAQVFYRRALDIPQKHGELLTLHARRGLAYHLAVESIFDQAHRELAMALDLARKMGFVQEMFNCRRILGAIYQMQGNTSAAVEQLQQALDHSEWSGNPLEVAKIHNTIAYISLAGGDYTSSLNHNIQALQLLINDFDPRYVEEINNTYNTMTELALFSGNTIQALKLLRFSMELAAFFSSRRSERHWNMIQSFRYMTYIYWRMDQPGQARAYLERYERNVREYEHFINTFELHRYILLLQDTPETGEIERIIAPILPRAETTVHVRIMLTQFYLDIHRKTGRKEYHRRARQLAERFGLSHLIESYREPVQLDWGAIDRRVPTRLLREYIQGDKRLKTLQSTMYRFDTVHEFSQRIINENDTADVIRSLFPMVRSQLEADCMYLYLKNLHGFVYVPDNDEEALSFVPAEPQQDSILNWGLQRGGHPANSMPPELTGRSVMIGELHSRRGLAGILVAANTPDDHWIYTDEDRNVLKNLMDLFSLKLENLEFIQRLADQSQLDDLTGVYNKRMFEPFLRELHAEWQLSGTPFSMIVLDGDDFKRINDTHGHLYGDTAIQKTATVIREHIREHDRLLRFGGDEFIVFLPHTSLAPARAAATRIRQALENSICTASIGVGEFNDSYPNTDRFFQAVDQALYQAKRSKNRVVAVGDSVPSAP